MTIATYETICGHGACTATLDTLAEQLDGVCIECRYEDYEDTETPYYRVTGRGSLQQLETHGRDQLHVIDELHVWATSRHSAELIAADYMAWNS